MTHSTAQRRAAEIELSLRKGSRRKAQMRKPSASPTDSGHISQHDSAVAKQQLEKWLDEALADTFPASDPIASPPGGGASDTRAHTRGKVNSKET
jgi:hypothetical protein